MTDLPSQGEMPKSMAIYFYPDNPTQALLKYHIDNVDHATFEVPLGNYKVLCFNDDVDGCVINNELSWSEFEMAMSMRDEPTWNNITKAGISERMVHEADTLWGSLSDNLITVAVNSAETAAIPVTTYPRPWCRTEFYDIDIVNIPSSIDVWSAYAITLSGMSGTHHAYDSASASPSNEAVTLAGRYVTSDYEHHSINGIIRAFARVQGVPHYLTVYCILADGLQHKLTIDVSDDVDAGQRVLHIDLASKPYTLEDYNPNDDDGSLGVLLRLQKWTDGGTWRFQAE